MNQDKFKKSFEELYKVAKTGMTKEDKDLLLTELDEMKATLEKWKAENTKGISHKKASWTSLKRQ